LGVEVVLAGELVLEAAEVGGLGRELDRLGGLEDVFDGGFGLLEGVACRAYLFT